MDGHVSALARATAGLFARALYAAQDVLYTSVARAAQATHLSAGAAQIHAFVGIVAVIQIAAAGAAGSAGASSFAGGARGIVIPTRDQEYGCAQGQDQTNHLFHVFSFHLKAKGFSHEKLTPGQLTSFS
jgi:hypothetical protein